MAYLYKFYLFINIDAWTQVLMASSLYITRRIFRQVWCMYLAWLCLWLVLTFICKWHSWSVSQMSRWCVYLLQHLNLCNCELCQACLTQRQIAQRRFMVNALGCRFFCSRTTLCNGKKSLGIRKQKATGI